MTPPQIIPRSAIDFGERGRTKYTGIEGLAESIEQNGLIQPIVLEPIQYDVITMHNGTAGKFKLSAGGRRLTALDFINVTEFYHGVTSEPGRYGYVLKGADESTPLRSLLTEIAENLDRHNLDWRDECRLIVRAWKLAKAEANAEGEKLIMRDFGSMLGVGYMQLQAAAAVVDDLNANPERFVNCTTIRGALSLKLGIEADALNARFAERQKIAPVRIQLVPIKEGVTGADKAEEVFEEHAVPLTSQFFNCDGITWLATTPSPKIDHIITDPDYGISVERLEASVANASSGVAQKSVSHTLDELQWFFEAAWGALPDHGFCVTFYDLDHHEKIQKLASDVGFAVQRWPIIWHKTDYRSNASPSSNFCKNIEYAIVCHKPGAVLQKLQPTSVCACPSDGITKELSHPFAKPRELWKFIFSAITIPGQTIFDPFFGSGSMPVAAIEYGLHPVGCEIQKKHYQQGVENIKRAYQNKYENVRFE